MTKTLRGFRGGNGRYIIRGMLAEIRDKGKILMHRIVTGASRGSIVDHINHDTIDNRKRNLRVVDAKINQANRAGLNKNNTSGVTGVYWESHKQKWYAQIRYLGQRKHLGYFDTKEVATLERIRW